MRYPPVERGHPVRYHPTLTLVPYPHTYPLVQMRRFQLHTTLLLLVLLSLSCARNPVTGKRELMLMSTAQEVAMGREADPQIIAAFGLYEDPALQKFIEEKGQEMAAISHRKDIEYSFKVVDSPVVNAFAVPGGFVYFTRGIMAHFNNEAEFAGVLGHEIGHITARHTAAQQSKLLLAQLGMAVGVMVSPELAQFGDLASTGVGLMFFKFGRDDERESDALGVEYSTTIGYDAQEMAGFFETLKRMSGDEGSGLPTFLSTHPSPSERLETVGRLATEWKEKLPQDEFTVGRNSYLQLIDGLVHGEDPRQGFFEAGEFFHPELKFRFAVPANWARQNTPQAVQMAPENGKALMILTIAQGSSLEEAAQATLQKYGLQQVESAPGTINGLPAIVMTADQPAQEQRPPLRTLTHLIQYEDRIYSIMGISTAADHGTYAGTFTQTGGSFAALTDAEKLNRQAERLAIRTVAQQKSLRQALRDHQIPDDRLEEFAVLNGMQLDDVVPGNTMIKVLGR
jgi:predicted Zn-dependent protease